jgi:hypothetical protein
MMKNIRISAAVLLLLSGFLHLGSVVFGKFEPTAIITLVFGIAYLVVGYFLLRSGRKILWWGAILPLVGLVLAILGMLMQPTLLGGIFILMDVLVAAGCFYLLSRKV